MLNKDCACTCISECCPVTQSFAAWIQLELSWLNCKFLYKSKIWTHNIVEDKWSNYPNTCIHLNKWSLHSPKRFNFFGIKTCSFDCLWKKQVLEQISGENIHYFYFFSLRVFWSDFPSETFSGVSRPQWNNYT